MFGRMGIYVTDVAQTSDLFVDEIISYCSFWDITHTVDFSPIVLQSHNWPEGEMGRCKDKMQINGRKSCNSSLTTSARFVLWWFPQNIIFHKNAKFINLTCLLVVKILIYFILIIIIIFYTYIFYTYLLIDNGPYYLKIIAVCITNDFGWV